MPSSLSAESGEVPGRPAVVVVNYGSSDLVACCLEFAEEMGELEVVVVDNFSTAAELVDIRRLAASRGWHLVEAAVNLGFGGAVDLGVRHAAQLGARRFLLLNPDAEIATVVARALLHAVDEPNVVVGPRIIDGDGQTYFDGAQVGLRSGRIRSVRVVDDTSGTIVSRLTEPSADWITGACVAFHWDLFQRLNGFGLEYFMYWEDVDFSHRAGLAGARIKVRRDITVTHVEGGTQAQNRGRAKSNLYYFYNTRNRLLFAARNLDKRSIVAWILQTPAVSWEILLRGGRRQIIQSPSTLISALRGSLAGIALASFVLLMPPKSEL